MLCQMQLSAQCRQPTDGRVGTFGRLHGSVQATGAGKRANRQRNPRQLSHADQLGQNTGRRRQEVVINQGLVKRAICIWHSHLTRLRLLINPAEARAGILKCGEPASEPHAWPIFDATGFRLALNGPW